jgi:hypothetical protein
MRLRPETVEADNQAIWTTALRLREFSYALLAAEAHISIERATLLIKGWQRARLADFDRMGDRGRHIFRLTAQGLDLINDLPANLTEKPAPATPEENMWRTARLLGAFGPTDIAIHATTTDVKVSEDDAHRYIQVLLRGGYLRVVSPARVSKKGGSLTRVQARYRLIRNTGPRPPVERRITVVVDANLGEYTYTPGVAQ